MRLLRTTPSEAPKTAEPAARTEDGSKKTIILSARPARKNVMEALADQFKN